MVHLLCTTHERRVQVLHTVVDERTDEIKTLHRHDGSACPSTTVKIGVMQYPITSSVFHAQKPQKNRIRET